MTIKNIDREKLLASIQPGFCKFNGFDVGAVIHELLAEPETDYRALYEAQCNELASASTDLESAKLMLRKVSSWLVCEAIATPDDMAQSFTPFREEIDILLSNLK